MPRRGGVPKRDVLPDPVYNSKVVTKLINQIMYDGKRGTAQNIVYGACSNNQPADSQRLTSFGSDFDGHLIVCSAYSPCLNLQNRHNVVHSLFIDNRRRRIRLWQEITIYCIREISVLWRISTRVRPRRPSAFCITPVSTIR